MTRKVLKDFTFSDGTTIPAGNFVAVASLSTHLDKINYESPDQFRGFRFADLREDEGESFKHSAVSLGLDWVTFGIGRHAWYVIVSNCVGHPDSKYHILVRDDFSL